MLVIVIQLVLGVSVGLLGLVIGAPIVESGLGHALVAWGQWQTLITGLLALIASLLGYLAATLSEREAHKRLRDAERAMLPFRLSHLCRVLASHGRNMARFCEAAEDERPVPRPVWTPVPHEFLKGFRENIVAGPRNLADVLAKLLTILQIIEARALSSEDPALSYDLSVYEARAQAIALAEAHALASGLFEFARGHSSVCPLNVSEEAIINALKIFDFHPEDDLVFEEVTLASLVVERFKTERLLTQKIKN